MAVRSSVHKAQSSQHRNLLREAAEEWEGRGLPRDLARRLSRYDSMTHFIWVADLSRDASITPIRAVQVWFATAHVTGLGALLRTQQDAASSRWIAAARASLHQDLCSSMLYLSSRVATVAGESGPLRLARVQKMLSNGQDLDDIWELARQVPAERDQLAAQIVLTTRLRTRVGIGA